MRVAPFILSFTLLLSSGLPASGASAAPEARMVKAVQDWATSAEDHVLRTGRRLTAGEIRDARRAGVRHPARIRVLAVPKIPAPWTGALRSGAVAAGVVSGRNAGLTVRYGIYIREDLAGDRVLLGHEFVHVAQYERYGGITPFLNAYLRQLGDVGYHQAPIEREAVQTADRLFKSPSPAGS